MTNKTIVEKIGNKRFGRLEA